MKVRSICILVLSIIILHNANTQSDYKLLNHDDIKQVVELPTKLNESSGIILTPYQTIISHNDSGDDPILYEFDLDTGDLIRKIKLENAKNTDWESITSDSKYIYVADIGNNAGSRKKLIVYKIPWPASGTENITAHARKIKMSYSDQIEFRRSKKHNYDCEAIISVGDSLYLFTKNRKDNRTNQYALSKKPGEYILTKSGSFNVDGLITDADVLMNGDSRILVLIGYNRVDAGFAPFIWTFNDFPGTQFLKGKAHRLDLQTLMQAEAIVFKDSETLYITNEEEEGGDGYLYKVALDKLIEE